jgi:hypothetical protein
LSAFLTGPCDGFVDLTIPVVQRLKAEQSAQPAAPGHPLWIQAWIGLEVFLKIRRRGRRFQAQEPAQAL